MKLPYNVVKSTQLIICYQVKLPVEEMGYMFLSHWPKGSYRPLQTLHTMFNAMSYP